MRVNEIFYSLQGEGFHTGTPSIFVRFSGCNLTCHFCDTQHKEGMEMSEAQIVEEVRRFPAAHVVITGGEPTLQLTSSLVDKLHQAGKYVAIETNGTHEAPANVDWITLSPKNTFLPQAHIILKECDELKVVFCGDPIPNYEAIKASHHFVQPCDTGNEEENALILKKSIAWCLEHPQWRLSLQTHKLIGVR